jgi:mRNA interferase MazF
MVEQFDIYWVDLNPIVGAEMQKVRPCVVVSPRELNRYLATVIIVPITSSIHGYPFRVSFRIEGHDGEIFIDQIRTVDKSRLKKEDCNTFS